MSDRSGETILLIDSLPNLHEDTKEKMRRFVSEGLDICMLFIITNEGIIDGNLFGVAPEPIDWDISGEGERGIK